MGYESDQAVEHELDLYAENTSELHRQFMSIISNVKRRIKNDTYDATKAPQLWMWWYNAAAKRYVQEFGGDVRKMFPRSLRMKLAKERAKEEYGKIKRGEYD